MDLTIGSLSFQVDSLGSIRLSDPPKSDPSADKTTTMAISESSVCSSSEVNSPVSFATIRIEDKIEELDEIMGNLDLGEAMDRLDLDQEDFTIRSSGVSSNVHQVYVIITKSAEENDDTNNIVVNTQDNKPRSNSGKEKEKIYVSATEWRIIMSAINHGTEVPANSRIEVLMGYQYALHQHKRSCERKKASSGKARRITVLQSDHTGMNTVKHLTPAKKDIANQSIAREK
jgi:hypothetical protein